MNSIVHRQFRFADFLLDESRGALLRDGEEIPLRRQAYDMLVLLVEHQGELVSKDFLMDAIWSDAVVTENSITQCLKEIRRAIGDQDLSMIRTIPRRGYIFELPVERLDTAAGSAAGAGTPDRRWLVGAVAILAVVAVAWWALQTSPPEQTTPVAKANPPPAKSVAVLPFTNMSPDLDVSYLADGVSEEILNQLAQIPDLLVIARTSSFTFRGRDVDIATIGRQLNVAHVLEGSVRVEGDTARVTAQLVSTDNQAHLWSRSYDRALDKIFDLQKGIARDVAEQLHVELADAGEGKSQRDRKPHPEAYAAYLRGQYLMAQRTPETVAGAMGEFRKAVELDADYAAAHADLAISTRLMTEGQHGDLPKHETVARARPHAQRALELDPELAEAHAAMSWVLDNKETKEQALFHSRRAVELRPNYADGAIWLSDFLISKGQYEESFELLERAVRSDPLSVVAMWNYSVALMGRGRLEEAGKVLEKLASLAPSFHRDLSVVFRGLDGQWAAAALTSLEARLEDPESSWLNSLFAIYLAAMGMDENALALTHVEEALLFELLGRPQNIVTTYEQLQTDRGLRDTQKYILGEALAAAGDFERALPYLEENWLFMDGVVAPPWFDAKAALALIAARRASGEDPGTEALAAALQDNARRYRDAGIVECLVVSVCIDFEVAIADYLSGDRQSAVRLLTKAVSSGYLIPPNSAYLQFLYDDPDLAPVFERQRAHVRAQRQAFLQAICPENPYAEVWQPVEGTCQTALEDSAVAVREPERGR
jgi:TolB-like protein/DNA-binding winged helix-turn-helix (wHTH) protein